MVMVMVMVMAIQSLKKLRRDYFPPNFKEYILKGATQFVATYAGLLSAFIFWMGFLERTRSRDPTVSLSAKNCADFNPNICAIPKVRDNIRHALQKLILLSSKFTAWLVQFWAPTRTSEGRTLLTIQNQPFAIGSINCMITRQLLYEYRMKMSREYNFFYADAESGEEQLGLPGLHKSPESTPYVKYYSTKRVSTTRPCCWHDEFFVRHMYDIFQELGLQCFDGFQACEEESRKKRKRVKGLACALEELKTVLRSVCEIHELPFAMTWVPCRACNGLQQCKLGSTGVEFCLRRDIYLSEFLKVSKSGHLRKGLVAGRAFSLNLLYCSDITQLSLDEYPLVHYARQGNFSGWFTLCLHSSYTRNDIYVLELFLPASNIDDENTLTRLSLILGTMEKKFKTFRLASGLQWGEVLSVEVIYLHNDQKNHSDQIIQAPRFLKDGGLMLQPQLDQPSTDVLNNGMNVFSEDQNYILDYHEPLQNGEVMMQLDSCDRPLS